MDVSEAAFWEKIGGDSTRSRTKLDFMKRLHRRSFREKIRAAWWTGLIQDPKHKLGHGPGLALSQKVVEFSKHLQVACEAVGQVPEGPSGANRDTSLPSLLSLETLPTSVGGSLPLDWNGRLKRGSFQTNWDWREQGHYATCLRAMMIFPWRKRMKKSSRQSKEQSQVTWFHDQIFFYSLARMKAGEPGLRLDAPWVHIAGGVPGWTTKPL